MCSTPRFDVYAVSHKMDGGAVMEGVEVNVHANDPLRNSSLILSFFDLL
jgi:hypothetical protein